MVVVVVVVVVATWSIPDTEEPGHVRGTLELQTLPRLEDCSRLCGVRDGQPGSHCGAPGPPPDQDEKHPQHPATVSLFSLHFTH